MLDESILHGKKILIVDDEPDVLAVLEELLSMCEIVKAASFDDAKNLLETRPFDIAILDIMGVDGYQLLDIAKKKKIPSVMLTAHAFTPDSLQQSIKGGADYYLSKEQMQNITEILADILQALKSGKDPWVSWQERFPPSYFEVKWGSMFWENIKEFKIFFRGRKNSKQKQ